MASNLGIGEDGAGPAKGDDFGARLALIMHWTGMFFGMPALMVLVGSDVVLRYRFNAPLPWGNEVGSLLLLIVFLASLPHTTRTGGHIRMDLFYGRLRGTARRGADVLTGVCGLVFASFLGYQAFATASRMHRLNDGAYLIDIPFWPFAVFMGLCGTFLAIQFATQIVNALRLPPVTGAE